MPSSAKVAIASAFATGVARGEGDLRAAVGQRSHERQAQPAIASGHQGAPAGQGEQVEAARHAGEAIPHAHPSRVGRGSGPNRSGPTRRTGRRWEGVRRPVACRDSIREVDQRQRRVVRENDVARVVPRDKSI